MPLGIEVGLSLGEFMLDGDPAPFPKGGEAPSSPESTTQTANRSVQPFLHVSRQKVPILFNGRPDPFPRKFLFIWGIWIPIYFRIPWGVRAHNPNGITIGSAVFSQVTAECPCTLQGATPSPSKLPLPIGGSGPQSNRSYMFPWATRVLNRTASRSVQPFLHGSEVQ